MSSTTEKRQVNIRLGMEMHRTLEVIARQQHRSVPQTVLLLLEEGMRRCTRPSAGSDGLSGEEIGRLAQEGGSFDWLKDEPDLYDDSCGEPV